MRSETIIIVKKKTKKPLLRSQLLACMATVGLVECVGRKGLLIASAVGMGLTVAGLTWYNANRPANALAEDTAWGIDAVVPAALTATYACLYSVGWGPVTMLVFTEVVHSDVRIYTHTHTHI